MYQTDPGALPDDRFSPGNLSWLVPGNHGRLLDARRTPVRVTAIDIHHGYFEVEILAFEDKGARWLIYRGIGLHGDAELAASGVCSSPPPCRELSPKATSIPSHARPPPCCAASYQSNVSS